MRAAIVAVVLAAASPAVGQTTTQSPGTQSPGTQSPGTQAPVAPTPLVLPVAPACVSSPFGERPAGGPRASRIHSGLDLPAPAGAWVRAAAPGRVVSVRRVGASGLEVTLDHGNGVATRYAHLGMVAPSLAEGRRSVAAGDALGRVGRTGVTYGTHLHFEVVVRGTRVDPAPYLPGVAPCRPVSGAVSAAVPP